jgi:hypothetical protein
MTSIKLGVKLLTEWDLVQEEVTALAMDNNHSMRVRNKPNISSLL